LSRDALFFAVFHTVGRWWQVTVLHFARTGRRTHGRVSRSRHTVEETADPEREQK
jgi:hypothetical protein